jgi:hypothetical protein
MDLERVAAVIRPRGYQEAIDLGFLMIRSWRKPVFGACITVMLPLSLVLLGALHRAPLWALLVLWWIKPLIDRIPLHVCSRALFGDLPSRAETLRALPSLLRRDSIAALTLYRFDPLRSFRLPVWQLEGLRGGARRSRMRVLARGAGHEAVRLTAICWIFEICMWFAPLAFILFLAPGAWAAEWLEDLAAFGLSPATQWLLVLAYAAAITLIEPFYAAAGFSLYLNRRTHLEAWDVEVAFRRIARRLQASHSPGAAAGLVLLVALAAAPASVAAVPAHQEPAPVAEPTSDADTLDPSGVVQEVLADPEFGSWETQTVWRLREQEPSPERTGPSLDLGPLLAALIEPTMWILAAAAIAVILIFVLRRAAGIGPRNRGAKEVPAPPEVLFGLDVREDSLPDDVMAAARDLWESGRRAEAIRLLYRGALARLIARDGLDVKESATEGDCLRLAARAISIERLRYLRTLTGVWQSTAYGHRLPEAALAEALIRDWDGHFGASA